MIKTKNINDKISGGGQTVEYIEHLIERQKQRIKNAEQFLQREEKILSHAKQYDEMAYSLDTTADVVKGIKSVHYLMQQAKERFKSKRSNVYKDVRSIEETHVNLPRLRLKLENLERSLENRQQQQKRFKGLLGFNGAFGRNYLTEDAKRMLVLSYGNRMGRAAAYEAAEYKELRTKCYAESVEDFKRWKDENEIGPTALGIVGVSFFVGPHETSGIHLYRKVNHYENNNSRMIQDEYAQTLLLPFTENELNIMGGGTNGTESYSIDPSTLKMTKRTVIGFGMPQ